MKADLMKKTILTLAVLSFLPLNLSLAKDAAFSNKDEEMLKELSKGSIEEVHLGTLAQNKGSNPAVKDFGKRMMTDHTALNNKVQEIAMQQGIALPKVPESGPHAMKHDLANRTGKDFDRHYIQGMLEDHQKDISKLQEYAYSTSNPKMQDLAKKAIPILENHIRIAEHVAGQLGVSADRGLNKPEHPTS